MMCGNSAVIRRAGMQHGVCCHWNRDRRSGASHIRTQLSAGSTDNNRTNWTDTGRTLFSAVMQLFLSRRPIGTSGKFASDGWWWAMMGDVFGRDSFARFGDDRAGLYVTRDLLTSFSSRSTSDPASVGASVVDKSDVYVAFSAFLFAMSNVAVNTDTKLFAIQFTQSCKTDAADMNDLGPCCWPFDPARRVTHCSCPDTHRVSLMMLKIPLAYTQDNSVCFSIHSI